MGALTPLFLAAGIAIGVPIYLHLFHRHETRRVSFPALRYLERTEREHARQIRFRQLVLLVIRVMVITLLVGAGARLFFNGRGSSHPPTAVVMILDNSMSSGLVVGESRVLDELKSVAHVTLDEASAEDRFWVLRAGEPWLPALPGTAAEARRAIDDIEASDGGGDLSAALRRAGELLRTSPLEHREIHLLSDLQASAFDPAGEVVAGDLAVVTWSPERPESPNHALTDVLVGRGLPPLEGQRTEVTVRALDTPDTTRLSVRLVVNERIRGAASVPPGSATSVNLPAAGSGWIRGYADSDPDALRADDRRYFAFRSRPAPRVAVAGDIGLFAGEALSVLESASRVQRVAANQAELLVAGSGAGLAGLNALASALVVPPADPTLLPALNRRLTDAGVPWRYEARPAVGSGLLEGRDLPDPLDGVRISAWYGLRLVGEPRAPSRIVAEVAGEPWGIQVADNNGRSHLLLASALDLASTSLPASADMVRFIDWVASEWAGSGTGRSGYEVGEHLSAPRSATHVRFPRGFTVEIDGTRTVRGTGQAGFYEFLEADTVVGVVALNPPVSESLLRAATEDQLEALLGSNTTRIETESQWSRGIFRARQGPEMWWHLLVAAVVLLVIEALIAAAGRVDTRASERRTASPTAMPDAAA
jgi:hypothetical protein